MPLTILGETHARKGLVFTYTGETDEGCKACRLHKVCHDLEAHRDYKVTAVRPVKHDVCHVFEGKVQVVEVEPMPLKVTIPISALRGSATSKHWDECGAMCLLKKHCNSPALADGQGASIQKVEGDVPCLVGRKLKFALVEPVR